MRNLELLAPARNADIGIAAIDCGADAVYIAGPAFGARQAAGNSMEEIRRLCEYAHRFGVRIFLTLNTILYDEELEEALWLKEEAVSAGVDALIVQDLAVLPETCWKEPVAALKTLRGSALSRTDSIPLHASTQCAIDSPEKARFYENLGFSRLVLEREMSLENIRRIRDAVQCELEFFVHGALCVCYSGQCYLSEAISGRSANRGACIQACRSLYDLVDDSGKVLVKDKALLSLKDFQLLTRLDDLAAAGIDSFKIEGRLKNISYVRNVTRAYSDALDQLIARHPESYRRASFGRVKGGFTPDLNKTFNRGYTELFLDGKRPDICSGSAPDPRPAADAASSLFPDSADTGGWSSMDAPTSIGEYVGTVTFIADAVPLRDSILTLKPASSDLLLRNGDGFSFLAGNEILGFKGDVCEGNTIRCRQIPGLSVGARLYRNVSSAFEKELENNLPVRLLSVAVDITLTDSDDGKGLRIRGVSEDGRSVSLKRSAECETARDSERMKALFENQIGKNTGRYSFTLKSLRILTQDGELPFLPVSVLNGIRRDLAARLDAFPCGKRPMLGASPAGEILAAGKHLTYKENVANRIAREVYRSRGAETVDDAYEIAHQPDAELMRTKYCIRYELGICPIHQTPPATGPLTGHDPARPLFLLNNGKRYALHFDCPRCEMTVTLP